MDTDISNIPFQSRQGGKDEAAFAGKLLLISTIIVNFTDRDDLFVLASIINLIAGVILIKSAYLESRAQELVPGVTTFANTLKVIGSTLGFGSSIILFISLITEVSIRQRGTAASALSSSAGATGTFSISI